MKLIYFLVDDCFAFAFFFESWIKWKVSELFLLYVREVQCVRYRRGLITERVMATTKANR